jgi:hypothetical protein
MTLYINTLYSIWIFIRMQFFSNTQKLYIICVSQHYIFEYQIKVEIFFKFKIKFRFSQIINKKTTDKEKYSLRHRNKL